MNNILRPELQWIEGRCYRVTDATAEISTFQEHDLYEDEVIFNDTEDEEDMEQFQITQLDDTRYSSSFHVSKHYIGSIIGKKGSIKNRLERDTNTEVRIPRQGETGDIVVLGPSAANVQAALRRINMIVVSSRMRQRPTHFISIPMNSEEIMKNFQMFKESILRECSTSRGLDESLFINPRKLHLTVGVMCLMDNEERMLASNLLVDAKSKIIMPLIQSHLPFSVRLKGLSYMKEDPRHTHVLYGRVREEGGAPTGLVQNLADALVEHFNKAGLMKKEFNRENVNLHVTFMNSRYRGRSGEAAGDAAGDVRKQDQPWEKKESFDCSDILEKFADHDFGVAHISDIHLSQMHSVETDDGYYMSTCVITCKSVTSDAVA